MSFAHFIEILGIVVYAISGSFSAMHKRLDAFGVIIIGFATALGGGTIRDVLIGFTPVTWMRDIYMPLIVLFACVAAMVFKPYIHNLRNSFIIFDSVGLGLFTMIGIQKGVASGLSPEICIILGTITGSFGGVLRDIFLNNIPQLFKKEIYATACIIGGIVYFFLLEYFNREVAKVITISLIFGIRIISVRYNLSIPKFYKP